MIIVTFNTKTKEIISVVPIDIASKEETELIELDGIVANGFDYIIYNGAEPLFKDDDGVLRLERNKLLLYGDYARG